MIFQILFACFFSSALDLPRTLNASERIKTLEILGFGTATKAVSFGYPLGGFPGVEVGINLESIPTQDLQNFGDRSYEKDSLTYTKFSIAKGLYKDVDVFIQFIPLNEDKGLSDYGGFIRWGFYEGTFFPINLSAILHGNNTNLNNLILSESVGWDFSASVFFDDFTIMTSVGFLNTNGRFLGCAAGTTGCTSVTDSNGLERASVHGLHTAIGISYSISKVFLAFQIDRYTQPVTSFKVGLRL